MSEWQPIETAPARTIILVCNPVEGFVPVVAKKVGAQWFNIGAVPIGRTSADYRLDPLPIYWMQIPEMPDEPFKVTQLNRPHEHAT